MEKTMEKVAAVLERARNRYGLIDKSAMRSVIVRCIDHTSLNASDSEESIKRFVESARGLDLASICVYPSMLEAAGLALGESDIALCSVCGAFPSGQTYLEVKLLEIALAIENGADEIDVVIDLGAIKEGQLDKAKSELEAMKAEIDDDAVFKVIIESGLLKTDQLIYNAAMVAMEGGADFVKTSTGMAGSGADPKAVGIICEAVKVYYQRTGRMVGVKVSGGVATIEDACLYYCIVAESLGEDWLNPELFRIGSSKLALSLF